MIILRDVINKRNTGIFTDYLHFEINLTAEISGMNPKASCGVLYPPRCTDALGFNLPISAMPIVTLGYSFSELEFQNKNVRLIQSDVLTTLRSKCKINQEEKWLFWKSTRL
ncbi:MAG: hypothetical protein CVU62_06080 [Deltaproteobacteria bacterium HGW-Deltaproteobacteria-2]|nr:MAG: hypothetical protein CVU62_06080 [Deltaproteobacteria bacterium HGW-Deltaproteobacteria-2]